MDLLGKFPMTYSEKPWHPRTMLYVGYHDEEIIREELSEEQHANFIHDVL